MFKYVKDIKLVTSIVYFIRSTGLNHRELCEFTGEVVENDLSSLLLRKQSINSETFNNFNIKIVNFECRIYAYRQNNMASLRFSIMVRELNLNLLNQYYNPVLLNQRRLNFPCIFWLHL